MPRFHERTERLLCRSAFVVLCLLPTLGVLAWAITVHLPIHRYIAAEQISDLLGVDAEVDSVVYPQPGIAELYKVTLKSPGEETVLATIKKIVFHTNGPNGREYIEVTGAKTSAQHLYTIGEALERADSSESTGTTPTIHIADLTIAPPTESVLIDPLVYKSLKIYPALKNGTIAESDTKPDRIIIEGTTTSSRGQPTKSRIVIYRGEEIAKSETRMDIESGSGPLPCWLLESLLPNSDVIGRFATVHGKAFLALNNDVWSGSFTGDVENIDASKVLDDFNVGNLKGTGRVHFTDIQWNAGRVIATKGLLECKQGKIDSKILNTAEWALNCIRPSKASLESLPFDEMKFRFHLDKTGIELLGNCSAANPTAMICYQKKPLLVQPLNKQPTSNLVFLFIDQINIKSYLPANLEAHNIAKWLPLSSILPKSPAPPKKQSDKAIQN